MFFLRGVGYVFVAFCLIGIAGSIANNQGLQGLLGFIAIAVVLFYFIRFLWRTAKKTIFRLRYSKEIDEIHQTAQAALMQGGDDLYHLYGLPVTKYLTPQQREKIITDWVAQKLSMIPTHSGELLQRTVDVARVLNVEDHLLNKTAFPTYLGIVRAEEIKAGVIRPTDPQALPLRLQPNETVVFCCQAQLWGKEKYRVSKGGYGGINYKMSKNLSVNMGTTESVSEYKQRDVAKDTGVLMISDQRVVFVGAENTFTTKLDKILSYRESADDIFLSLENSADVVRFSVPQSLLMATCAALDYVLK